MFYLFLFSFASSIGIIIFYLWFLTWPRSISTVDKVHEGIANVSAVRSPRKYRHLVFKVAENNGVSYFNRQSLFAENAFSLKKNKGDQVVISICKFNSSFSCPFRPFLEFFITAFFVLLIFTPYLLLKYIVLY